MTKVLANSQNQFQNHIDWTIQPASACRTARTTTGASQPPRNMIEASVETRIMLAYSARKNIANAMPEYSTMWPATISDSPSTTSNGCAVGLGDARDDVDDEDRQQRQPVPRQEAQARGRRTCRVPWPSDDVGHVQARRDHQHDDEREAHRDLVADHLRRRAQRAEERVLRVRRPAGDDDAVDLDRRDRHQEQQAGVDVGERDVGAERHHRPGGQRRHDRHDRAEEEQARLAAVGTMISLKISLTASAIGCSRPSGPTRFGPGRIWIQPIALRSHSVR